MKVFRENRLTNRTPTVNRYDVTGKKKHWRYITTSLSYIFVFIRFVIQQLKSGDGQVRAESTIRVQLGRHRNQTHNNNNNKKQKCEIHLREI
jgi:hypothetical protein